MNNQTLENTLLTRRIKYIAISGIITAIMSIISFFFALTTFLSEVPIWCDYSPFKELKWCQSPPPCNNEQASTVECAKNLFGDKNNPAHLKIETLKNNQPTTVFRNEDMMEMRLSSDNDGYVFIFNIEPDGKLINYFPNQYCHDLQQGHLQAGKTLTIPGIPLLWPCEFPVTSATHTESTGTLLVVLVETALEYNVLPLVFNKYIEMSHAKSLLYLLRQQLDNLTVEDENGEVHEVRWSVKLASYKIITD